MGSGNKRRYHQGRHRHDRDRSDIHNKSREGKPYATQGHSDAKRRRLSTDSNSQVDQRSSTPNDDGWTKVTYNKTSGSRVTHSDLDRPTVWSANTQNGSAWDAPSIRYALTRDQRVNIKDLRDLVLYVLSDGVAPNWCAVQNAKAIEKVVCLMVPGLDEDMLSLVQASLETKSDTQEAPDSAGLTLLDGETIDKYRWLLDNTIPVVAPGDTKSSRVHSPLQAMLMVPESVSQKKDAFARGNSIEACRIAITELVHSADDLRDADYPIHPATFVSEADAKLEASRRERTGQGPTDGWRDTNVLDHQPQTTESSSDWLNRGLDVYAIDCEMVQTSDGASSLARISVVRSPDGQVILDTYVKPSLTITNYFTQYSGITPEILADVTTTLSDVQEKLMVLLTPSTIILGHSLDSDLNAMKMTHPFIVDTSIIYPHPRGLPLRSSLKFLANKYLKREIQTGGANGHDSVEDAKAVMDLVKLKCERGVRFGTMEANGEPIFKRLGTMSIKTAIVEYGTPERGFGKDATYHIGCQSDPDVVQGVIKSVSGVGSTEHNLPADNVTFAWGRLRKLEICRGWATASDLVKQDQGNSETLSAEPKVSELVLEALSTLRNIQLIYDNLPARTLLVIFSGTSDLKDVLRYQAMHQQFKKEYKVKKWDELSVKWTDNEEQALRKACNSARRGWAVSTVIEDHTEQPT